MNVPEAKLAEDAWGGEQVMLMVGPDKAELRLGCAEGEFPAPVMLDAEGRFSVSGSFHNADAGPAVPGKGAGQAGFEGVVSGDQLTLDVSHGGTTETYRLTRGLRSKVIRCL